MLTRSPLQRFSEPLWCCQVRTALCRTAQGTPLFTATLNWETPIDQPNILSSQFHELLTPMPFAITLLKLLEYSFGTLTSPTMAPTLTLC